MPILGLHPTCITSKLADVAVYAFSSLMHQSSMASRKVLSLTIWQVARGTENDEKLKGFLLVYFSYDAYSFEVKMGEAKWS